MGLLALYPEAQEKLYEQVKQEVADPSGAPVRVNFIIDIVTDDLDRHSMRSPN